MAFKKQSRNHRRFRRPPTSFARRSNAVLNSSSKLLHGPLLSFTPAFLWVVCGQCAPHLRSVGGDDSKPRWSGAGNTQFTLPARHDKTVLSVSCPAVWIESRDRLATSEQLVDKSPCLGQPHSSWWWRHDVGYPLLDAEHSLCMVWNSLPDDLRAQQDMSPLDRAWKPSFSLDTSVFSAFETLW